MSEQAPQEQGEHVHHWQPNGLVRTSGEQRSPVSRMDSIVYTKVHSVLVCSCGKTKTTHIANENVERYGDRLRRQRR